jgi:hypothetical protein
VRGRIPDVFRDPLSINRRDAVAMTAPAFAPRVAVAIGPSGVARYDDGILEIVEDGLRVAARDVVAIELLPALGARLQLRLTYRQGFATLQRRCWAAATDHDHLQRLVKQVRAA